MSSVSSGSARNASSALSNVDARELADGSDEGGRASTARSVDGGTAAAATAAAASTTASTHG